MCSVFVPTFICLYASTFISAGFSVKISCRVKRANMFVLKSAYWVPHVRVFERRSFRKCNQNHDNTSKMHTIDVYIRILTKEEKKRVNERCWHEAEAHILAQIKMEMWWKCRFFNSRESFIHWNWNKKIIFILNEERHTEKRKEDESEFNQWVSKLVHKN